VRIVKDPRRGDRSYLVLCEVLNPDGTPHETNQRAALRGALDAAGPAVEPWAGFEQEYTVLQGSRPLGFPENGYPAPQDPITAASAPMWPSGGRSRMHMPPPASPPA
jgi:glutamine synthetase